MDKGEIGDKELGGIRRSKGGRKWRAKGEKGGEKKTERKRKGNLLVH